MRHLRCGVAKYAGVVNTVKFQHRNNSHTRKKQILVWKQEKPREANNTMSIDPICSLYAKLYSGGVTAFQNKVNIQSRDTTLTKPYHTQNRKFT